MHHRPYLMVSPCAASGSARFQVARNSGRKIFRYRSTSHSAKLCDDGGMTEPARQGIPLRPDYSARPRPSDAIVRAVLAHAHSFLKRDAPPEAHAKAAVRRSRWAQACRETLSTLHRVPRSVACIGPRTET